MALKDRIITVDEVRALEPMSNPLLYVDANWTGTLLQVLDIPIASMLGKMWVVVRFFNEANLRKLVVKCIVDTAVAAGVDSTFANAQYNLYLAGNNVLPAVDNRLRTATVGGNAKAIRLLWGLHWALSPVNPTINCKVALRDVMTCHKANKQFGIDLIKTNLLSILDTHP